MSQFKKGDAVQWTSQAGGKYTTKEGTVYAVVKAGSSVFNSFKKDTEDVYTPQFDVTTDKTRKTDSYLVAVKNPVENKKDLLYWPIAKQLELKVDAKPEPVIIYIEESEGFPCRTVVDYAPIEKSIRIPKESTVEADNIKLRDECCIAKPFTATTGEVAIDSTVIEECIGSIEKSEGFPYHTIIDVETFNTAKKTLHDYANTPLKEGDDTPVLNMLESLDGISEEQISNDHVYDRNYVLKNPDIATMEKRVTESIHSHSNGCCGNEDLDTNNITETHSYPEYKTKHDFVKDAIAFRNEYRRDASSFSYQGSALKLFTSLYYKFINDAGKYRVAVEQAWQNRYNTYTPQSPQTQSSVR
jgi:hypothetical protein